MSALLHVETHVRSIESSAEQSQGEYDGVGHLEHAVVPLPQEVQEQGDIHEVDKVLREDVCVSQQRAGFSLTHHSSRLHGLVEPSAGFGTVLFQ